MKVLHLLIFFMLNRVVHNARILFVAPIPSYSHQIFYRKIWLELAERGHNLTVLTTDIIQNPPPNVRQIDWHFAYEIRRKKYNISEISLKNEGSPSKIIDLYLLAARYTANKELNHSSVQELLQNKDEYFDLVIVEFHFPIMFAFSSYFNCPYIGITSTDIHNIYHSILGNPTHPLLYANDFLPIGENKYFSSRLARVKLWLQNVLFISLDVENAIVKKYFGENMPDLLDITKNVSLVLLNSNPIFNSRPLVPGVIRIGGATHLEPVKPLPKDLQTYLDDTEDGVIYFSLGTNIRKTVLPQYFINVIRETFREIPYKIVWKLDGTVPDISSNVRIYNWVPQQDILRHKNMKLFITQGGLQSVEEAMFSHVPMLVIPFVSDQKSNAKLITDHKMGVALDWREITKDNFKSAILDVIKNSSYKTNTIKTATYIQDQPMTGLETAIWWIEYVIRHRGAKQLWNFNDLPLYQYFMLDVFAYLILYYLGILVLYIAFTYFAYRILKKLYVAVLSRNKLKNS